MSRKKRPSSRPRSRRDRDQSPESKAIKKEMNLKKKERGGGKRKSKGKKERFNKEELTGTVSMTPGTMMCSCLSTRCAGLSTAI